MNRIPSLDGWRAVAITMVMLAHFHFAAGFPFEAVPYWDAVFQGDVGVRIFFVISGFLITGLLLQGAERTGRPSLRRFYIRRALRILPVYYGFVVVLLVLAAARLYTDAWTNWMATLTFTRNLIGRTSGATIHFWSLSIEEQFYLVWPMTLVTFALWRRFRLAVGLLLVVITAAPLVRLFGPGHGLAARLLGQYSPVVYGDSLAIGCLGAFVFANYRQALRRFATRAVFIAAVAGIAAVWGWEWRSGVGAAVGPLIQAVMFMVAIWVTVERRTGVVYRVLNAPPVVWLGTLSYSLYVWQQFFLGRFAGAWLADSVFWRWPLWWLSALGAACVSHYALERPILALRNRFVPTTNVIQPSEYAHDMARFRAMFTRSS